jgi:hypothetical protein
LFTSYCPHTAQSALAQDYISSELDTTQSPPCPTYIHNHHSLATREVFCLVFLCLLPTTCSAGTTAPLLLVFGTVAISNHFPHDLASWILVAGGGAVTRDHVDAAGLATWIHVLAGQGKVWLTCLGPKDPSCNIFDNATHWVDDQWSNSDAGVEYLLANFYWDAIYLAAGSTL